MREDSLKTVEMYQFVVADLSPPKDIGKRENVFLNNPFIY